MTPSESLRSSSLPHPKVPIPSRLLPAEGYSGLDVIPYNYDSYSTLPKYLLENSPLTMTLCEHHLHCASVSEGLYSLDFQLVTSLWFILKDISRTIQLAANPLLDPFNSLPSTVDLNYLNALTCLCPLSLQLRITLRTCSLSPVLAQTCVGSLGLRRRSDWMVLSGYRWLGRSAERRRKVLVGTGPKMVIPLPIR